MINDTRIMYLVTTDKELLPHSINIAMVDGTVPGFIAKASDIHFDHHRAGGAPIQCDEVPMGRLLQDEDPWLIVTTKLDADACVAAAWLQLDPLATSEEDKRLLRAIAWDCDYLKVPDELSDLADFAAQAVVTMKSTELLIAAKLNLPANYKDWTEADKSLCATLGFKTHTKWLLAAAKGKRPYPGEMGEAAIYWHQIEWDVQGVIDEDRVHKYKDALVFDMMGWGGRWVDGRVFLRAAKQLGLSARFELRRRETKDGWAYTIVANSEDLIGYFDAFRKLTLAEADKRGIDEGIVNTFWGSPDISDRLGFDPWGGREAVGGSGWRTGSLLSPEEVINTLL